MGALRDLLHSDDDWAQKRRMVLVLAALLFGEAAMWVVWALGAMG